MEGLKRENQKNEKFQVGVELKTAIEAKKYLQEQGKQVERQKEYEDMQRVKKELEFY